MGHHIIEAKCDTCDQTFNPHGLHADDLIHYAREDGEECGGTGTVLGTWGRDLTSDREALRRLPTASLVRIQTAGEMMATDIALSESTRDDAAYSTALASALLRER